ncbi:hypothetical protein F0562_005203 [Nyssa sinensis]|uniref:RING-type E3 ubiquitin transferase n=1 Tax=Nyssa sinensis TaxID=561372 RepID=A0A5J5AJM9_9ASTE|nr:hypothetical protein F0562_005203 [Nyssa sinensis]
MEEVSNNLHVSPRPNVHHHHQQQQQLSCVQTLETRDSIDNSSHSIEEDDDHGDLSPFDSDSLSPPNPPFFTPSSAHPHYFNSNSDNESESESESESDYSDSNCFYGDDQMNFVTNLFESRVEHVTEDDPLVDTSNSDVNFGVFEGSDEFDSYYAEELGLGFGSRIEFDRVAFASESSESPANRGSDFSRDGLRVVGIESESDSEDTDVNSEVCDEGTDGLGDSDIPLFWDCLGFEDQRTANEELEWEEVDERVDDREGLSSVFDHIEEISVSSDTSSEEEPGDSGEEAVRNLEWEILLAVNNLDRAYEIEQDGDGYDVTYIAIQDDYIYEAEYDTLFGQFVQNESALKGSPPAAKSFVENLPLVILTKEQLRENKVVCAICKEEILVEEKVTRLPCSHHYHGQCIVPWLSIRNTCPVCRHELPTDDLDYEQSKT